MAANILRGFDCIFHSFLLTSSFVKAFNHELPRLQKKKPVDFDDELRIGDVRYDNMT